MIEESEDWQGLTSADVQDRVARGLTNKTDIKVSKSILQIILTNTCTYFNLIFAILGFFVFTTFATQNVTLAGLTQLSFLLIVIVNTLIGIIQELRAKRVLDKMTLLNAPKTTVIRDGHSTIIPSSDLVQDDLIQLSAGNSIPADARICSGIVAVNESLLTGEEREIPKKTGDALLSGSFIVSGTCTAVLEKVGSASFISQLSLEAKKMKRTEQSEMTRSVNKLLKWIGIIIIPVGGLLFLNAFLRNAETYAQSVYSAVGAVTAMIPEGLYLLMTVVLAVGTIRLAKHRVLLHEMKSIETLARVDVLCVDKTGTITQPKMEVAAILPFADGGEQMLASYVHDAVDTNNTMTALKSHLAGTGLYSDPLEIIPFSSSTKCGVIRYVDTTLILGAPEFVLKADLPEFTEKTKEYAGEGDRVLVLAREPGTYSEGVISPERKAVSAVILHNALRENAVETFRYFHEEGVTIKVISGDSPLTVSAVARRAGILHADQFVDATTLTTDDRIADAAKRYTVFGRVTPEQKQKLILAMKEQGHTVAMTGDGVNDILAMKDADCSIAMASGCDAAAQASQVVLLDSEFACMPQVVFEGRRAINNLQRSAILFLSKNTFSLILSLLALIVGFTYPLTAAQILLISVFTIGLPGLLLAFERNNTRIKGHFLKNVLLRALPAGITSSLAVGALTLLCKANQIPYDVTATAATIVLAAVGFMILRRISTPFTKYRLFVYLFSIAGIVAAILFLPMLFGLAMLSIDALLPIVIIIAAAEVIFFFVSKGIDRILNK
ncbi:MAG TPA: HAD-IC family P-type ATPase [Methanocorpusculum sp.]|nr:HAD-IC family P-type ATPase [Methanocorpusculum sp.]